MKEVMFSVVNDGQTFTFYKDGTYNGTNSRWPTGTYSYWKVLDGKFYYNHDDANGYFHLGVDLQKLVMEAYEMSMFEEYVLK